MRQARQTLWTTLTFAVLAASAEAAAPPTDALFPNTTRGFISASDVTILREKWNQTQFGQFLDDPLMRPFLDAVEKQFREDRAKAGKDLGITIDDLFDVAKGEAALGLVHVPGKLPAEVMLADVTDRQPQALELLTKVFASLTRQGGKWTQSNREGTKWTVFTMPKDPKSPNQSTERVYFIKNDMLCACKSVEVAAGIFGRFKGASTDALKAVKSYRAVMDRCEQDVKQTGDSSPQIRWYVQPLQFATARRTTNPKFLMSGKMDIKLAFENAGFQALEAVGGTMALQTGQFDLYHRAAAYAPAAKYEKSMNMLDLPNGQSFAPAAWMPAELSSYTAINLNLKKVIDHIGPVFNETVGEGDEMAWQNALDGIVSDPKGPQVDLQTMLFDQLGKRVTTVSDSLKPVGVRSERRLFVAEIKDAAKVQAALEQNYKVDKSGKKAAHGGVDYWEIAEKAPAQAGVLPPVVVIGPGGAPAPNVAVPALPEEPKEPSAIGVVRGELIYASHASLMKKAIDGAKDGRSLAQDSDYVRVTSVLEAETKRRSWSGTSVERFTRAQDAYQPTYELARLNLLPHAKTWLGRILNSFLNNTPDGRPRKQQVDGAILPEYAKVRHYFLNSGYTIVSEDAKQFKGWFLVGFTLAKDGAAVANKPK